MPLSTPSIDVRGRPFFRFLDTLGNGSGIRDAIADFSNVATDFFITPPQNQTFSITHLLTQIVDMGNIVAAKYGNINELTNGIKILLLEKTTITRDLTNGLPIKNNEDWARFCFDTTLSNFGGGSENYVDAICRFELSGAIILPFESSLAVRLNDDFSGLLSHTFLVQGKII